MIQDFGYPWGRVYVPKGYKAGEVLAACDADDHFSHPACHPGWEGEVAERGGIVLRKALVDTDWRALVAFPAAPLDLVRLGIGLAVTARKGSLDEVAVDEVDEVALDLTYRYPALRRVSADLLTRAWKAWGNDRYYGTCTLCVIEPHTVAQFVRDMIEVGGHA